MEVEVSNPWPTFVGEDLQDVSLLERTDKLMIAATTRKECVKGGIRFSESKLDFNTRLVEELSIPQVIYQALIETGELTNAD